MFVYSIDLLCYFVAFIKIVHFIKTVSLIDTQYLNLNNKR